MTTYEITKNNYIDEYGKPGETYYLIRWRKSHWFFGIKYWKYVTERSCGMGDCYDSTLGFKTKENAECHVKEILCKGIKTESVKEELVSKINCDI